MHLGALPPAFAGLESSDAQEAASFLELFTLDAGEPLMEQGEEDYTLAFLVQGAVSILDHGVRIGGAGARDMIGEVELFGQVPRTATVVASSPTQMQVLAYEAWVELCDRGNPAVFNIERHAHRRIGDRLRALSEGIAERATGVPMPAPPASGLLDRLSGLFAGRSPTVDVAAALGRSPLFGGIDPAVIAQIAPSFHAERVPARTEICRQGELGERAFVLAEGEVDVVVATGPDAIEPIASLSAGATFGDALLAQHAPRHVSCVAHTDSVLLSIDRIAYGALFSSDDPVGSAFRQGMIRGLVAQLIASQARFLELERAAANQTERVLRGTPVSTVWRD
ncbi:MAG: cyclic nucleotide-binding domain-containing protein [Myxococcota bacterium]